MKTERRHELATNDLSDWLGDKIEELKPYSTAIWASVLGVLVLIAAGVYWSRQSEASLERGWDRFFLARADTTTEKLRDAADDHPTSAPALWSRLSLADRELAKGVDLLFEDRAAAQEALKDAADAYRYTIEHAPSGSLLAERATFGLGEAFESQNELEKARKQYADVESQWPGGPFSMEAQRRLADLDRASTKAFYDWFANQEPKRKPPAKKGLPGAGPDFDLDKLEEHPFHSQIDLDSKTFGGAAPKATEKRAAPKKAAEEKEGEKQLTDEKPATGAALDDSSPDKTPPADKTPEEK
ncbi:MAG TPA: hypothetical protein VN699_12405 [Pirellulales bacterium]|nr:hypothetical protein [Pirellulales bacterium]